MEIALTFTEVSFNLIGKSMTTATPRGKVYKHSRRIIEAPGFGYWRPVRCRFRVAGRVEVLDSADPSPYSGFHHDRRPLGFPYRPG